MNHCQFLGLLFCSLFLGTIGFCQDKGQHIARPDKIPPTTKQPPAVAKDLQALVDGNNEFALDLYARLSKEKGNVVFSPYSISTVLAMTYGGARGQTAEEMAKVLHFQLPQERLHSSFGKLATDLQNGGKDRPFHLSMANAIWGRKGEPFVKEYLQLTEKHYGSGVKEIDFSAEPHKVINRWVEDKTRGKIKDLLSESNVNASTRFVLTNAIYFKATWLRPFPKENTKEASFEKTASDKIQVAMMSSHKGLFSYHDSAEFKFVELPYKGDRLSMVLMLPQERGRLAEAEAKFSPAALQNALSKLKAHMGVVELPRFTMTQRYYLTGELGKMGMVTPFKLGADFSGISPGVPPIGQVIHQAFVDVDEVGTEAAAATAEIYPRTAFPSFSFRADQPFLFLIRDCSTGSILFVGRMASPPAFRK